MSRIVSWVEAFALSIGGPGLFVVAFLDSSFLSLPEINDLLVVLLVIQHKERMAYYALMATAGSIVGCLVLYSIGRGGGRRFSDADLVARVYSGRWVSISAMACWPSRFPRYCHRRLRSRCSW